MEEPLNQSPVRKLFALQMVESIMVTVNYDQPKAIEAAIKANRFDGTDLQVPPSQIPLVGRGKVNYQVSLYNFAMSKCVDQIFKEFSNGFALRLADPLTTLLYQLRLREWLRLRYQAQLPDLLRKHQMLKHRLPLLNHRLPLLKHLLRKHWLANLFYSTNGELSCMAIIGDVSGKCQLTTDKESPDGVWRGDYWFPCVPSVMSSDA